MRSQRTRVLTASLALTVAGLATAAPAWALRVTPQSPASPNADDERTAYVVAMILMVIAVVAINGAIIAAVRRGRSTDSPERARARHGLLARLTGGLTVVAALIFTFAVLVTEQARDVDAATGKAEPLEILVSGQQWVWRYEYPDGTFSYHDLVVPVGTPVHLEVNSVDVRHRWSVPALGGSVDAVPGHRNNHWFRADETGVYRGASTQFSGPAFATMRTAVRVVEPAEYEDWLAQQASDIAAAQKAVNDEVLKTSTEGAE